MAGWSAPASTLFWAGAGCRRVRRSGLCAALIAQAKQHYAAALHDITTGDNDVAEIGGGFNAGTRWDPVTGLGTPIAATLLPLLVARTS